MKRLFDVIVVLIFSPLVLFCCLLLALIIYFGLGSPVIFTQVRPGLNGKLFKIYKFRTLTNEKNSAGSLLPDEFRLTAIGSFLRSSSLDELPGLWNVLKGDMSLVGPRPLLVEYLPLYNVEQSRRHEVKPGITGWAQVNGRNAISWEEKFKFDIWYIDNQSFVLDIKIILLTIKKVFVRDDINAEGEATMNKFQGSSKND